MRLPLGRAFLISLKSIRIRIGRSLITASGVFLGIAFLVSVLAQGLVQWPLPAKDVLPGYTRLDGEFEGPGDYPMWSPVSREEALAAGMPEAAVDRASRGGPTLDLSKAVAEMNYFRENERRLPAARALDGAYRRLPRSLLTGKDTDTVEASDLRAGGLPDDEVERIAKTGSVTLKDLKAAKARAAGIVRRMEGTKARLAAFGTVPDSVIARLSGEKEVTLADVLAAAAQRSASRKAITSAAERTNLMIVNAGGRKIRVDLTRNGSAEKVRMVSGDVVFIPEAAGANRRIWLVVMSLLVCTIGITNAMLMAVTERFREIGTMKCLGALDRFVVELFLFESALLGIAASVAGAFAGFGAVMLLAAATKGWAVFGQVGVLDVLWLFGIGAAVGCTVTLVATVAPAFRAAKLPPAAALRMEV